VRGIKAETLIQSVLTNNNYSKPIGPRNYLVINDSNGKKVDLVQTGDAVIVNRANLLLSILFYDESFIEFPNGSQFIINSFGLNETVIHIPTSLSYWHMYAVEVLDVFNLNPKPDTKKKDFTSKISSNIIEPKDFIKAGSNSSSSRKYSTMVNPLNILENDFSNIDDLIRFLGRYHIPDYRNS
jgi:hypothetical protein